MTVLDGKGCIYIYKCWRIGFNTPALIAQLGERQTEDLKVSRSIRDQGMFILILFAIVQAQEDRASSKITRKSALYAT